MRLYDAHNHLQDERLAPHLAAAIETARQAGVTRMVVNGSCEADWPAVLALAQAYPVVLPSFGYHPWYVEERTPDWKQALTSCLDQVPSAVGEIGLDRWIEGYDLPQQQEAFVWQLGLAAERNLPVSVHCLQAWGLLLQLLTEGPRPVCGIVLHSYGGAQEMIAPLAKLGAYFSLPGYFAHERKVRQRETFRLVPLDRLLIETDAPDQLLPTERIRHPLRDGATGKSLNHPAELASVYEFAAELRAEPVETLARQVEENFQRVFGGVSKGINGNVQ